jgi:hypothetical protein
LQVIGSYFSGIRYLFSVNTIEHGRRPSVKQYMPEPGGKIVIGPRLL